MRRAESMVAAISRSGSPVDRAAAASSARTVSSPASAARQAAQNRPSFRLSFVLLPDPGGEVAQVAALDPGRLDGGVALRVRAGR